MVTLYELGLSNGQVGIIQETGTTFDSSSEAKNSIESDGFTGIEKIDAIEGYELVATGDEDIENIQLYKCLSVNNGVNYFAIKF